MHATTPYASASNPATDVQKTALEHAEDGSGAGDHVSDGFEGLQLHKAGDVDLSVPPSNLKDMTPTEDKGACGLYATASKDGKASHSLVHDTIEALDCLAHRNGHTRDPKTTDGFGVAFHGVHKFWKKVFGKEAASPGDYIVMPVFMPHRDERFAHVKPLPDEYKRARTRLEGILQTLGLVDVMLVSVIR